MVIHYLQCGCRPPVLPCLQKMMPNIFSPSSDIKRLNLLEPLPNFLSLNAQSLGELLLGFLYYFSYMFKFAVDVMSVRLGSTLDKETARNYVNSKNTPTQWRWICIEEPFDRTNTARSVWDEQAFTQILNVFRTSHYRLERTKNLSAILWYRYIYLHTHIYIYIYIYLSLSLSRYRFVKEWLNEWMNDGTKKNVSKYQRVQWTFLAAKNLQHHLKVVLTLVCVFECVYIFMFVCVCVIFQYFPLQNITCRLCSFVHVCMSVCPSVHPDSLLTWCVCQRHKTIECASKWVSIELVGHTQWAHNCC